jgi:tyrosine-protein kinase Etk/Wzc
LAALPVTAPCTGKEDHLDGRYTKPHRKATDEIDLGELLCTLVDHKWLIVIVTGAFFVISVACALLATPTHGDLTRTLGASSSEATTEIALAKQRFQQDGV